MEKINIFDVAASILSRADAQAMSSVKLQKLAFYTFGWYAHLTAERLFDNRFYAMENGPVVSDLLTLTKPRDFVGLELLAPKAAPINDRYVEAVIDAVWDTYGSFSEWDLSEFSHSEQTYETAWSSKSDWYARADLDADEIVREFALKDNANYFLKGKNHHLSILEKLPEARVRVLSEEAWNALSTVETPIPQSLSARAAKFRSMIAV